MKAKRQYIGLYEMAQPVFAMQDWSLVLGTHVKAWWVCDHSTYEAERGDPPAPLLWQLRQNSELWGLGREPASVY